MHLHLGLDDYLFDDLNRKLKSSGASEYIHSLKEMYVDFMGMMSFFSALRSTLPIFELVALIGIIIDVVKESAVFTVEPSTSYLTVFGTDPHSDPDFALRTIAKQLLSVCVTLGEDPIIRFQSNDGDPKSPTRFLASMLQKEIDSFCRLNTNFPVGFLQLENLFEKGRSS